MRIGVLHPGEMGSALGACLVANRHDVLWASSGRSSTTADRAARERFRDAGSADAVAAQAHVIVSICPPHAALDVAVAVAGFTGTYVDANAISPGRARRIAGMFDRYVDGSVVGPPPHARGTTRLYLSGSGAEEIAELFAGSAVDARVVGNASALKMVYAAWSKGNAALLLALEATAEANGVAGDLHEEWRLSAPELHERLLRAERAASEKGWRWIGEMEEIADTFASAGQPEGFHRAAAEVYRARSSA